MTHDRHYRVAHSMADALSEIDAEAGRQFDPELARLFIDAIEDGALEGELAAVATVGGDALGIA